MKRNNIISIALATLVLWLGLQNFHVYLPSVLDYLTTYFEAGEPAGYALVTFAMALLLPLVYRLLGEKWLLIVTVAGTAIIRLAIQFTDSQAVHLVLSTIGVILWIWFIPFWHQSRRNRPEADSLAGLVIAFPLAIFLDTMTRALIWFDEIAWQDGLLRILFIAVLSGVVIWLLRLELKENSEQFSRAGEEPALSRLWPFLGVGPALYLQLIIFTNPAKLVPTLPGVDIRWVYLFILGLAAFGVFEVIEASKFFYYRRWLISLILGGALVVSLLFFQMGIELGWLWFGVAGITTWALFGILLNQTSRQEPLKNGIWRDGLVTFLALLLMLLIFYMVDEIGMLFINVVAGILLLLAALWAAWKSEVVFPVVPEGVQRLIAAVFILTFAVFGIWAWIN